jgi:hypothetical protein
MRRYRRIGFEERIKIFRLWLDGHGKALEGKEGPDAIPRLIAHPSYPHPRAQIAEAKANAGQTERACQIANLLAA